MRTNYLSRFDHFMEFTQPYFRLQPMYVSVIQKLQNNLLLQFSTENYNQSIVTMLGLTSTIPKLMFGRTELWKVKCMVERLIFLYMQLIRPQAIESFLPMQTVNCVKLM